MSRVAVIDCGTNSIRLLIADPSPAGLAEIDRRVEVVRLGQGVDAIGAFHPDAVARTFAAIDGYAAEIERHGVDKVRFVATSASRDVANRDEFEAGVRERLGVGVDVLTGDEEARLSFTGALAVLQGQSSVASGEVLVTDIGGGSTELVLGERDGSVVAATSLDVGAVRLRERFLHSDPVTPAERDEATVFVDDLLDACGVDLHAATWIGVAGTMTSMAAIHHGLREYDRSRVHGSLLTPSDVGALTERLISAPVTDLEKIPTLAPMRAQVIGGGALICERIARRVGAGLIVSETDILDAVALELLG